MVFMRKSGSQRPVFEFGQRIDLTSAENNFSEDNSIFLRIPLYGPKGSGSLFSQFDCDQTTQDCEVRRLEFQVESSTDLDEEQYKGQRLLVYDSKIHGPIPKSK